MLYYSINRFFSDPEKRTGTMLSKFRLIFTLGGRLLPIIGKWKNPAVARCYGKQAYRRVKIAEDVARRDSERTGQLIIAYQCYDCGRFHVGHADLSQRIARQQFDRTCLPAVCPHCGGPIPEERRRSAWESGNRNVYCSKRCQRKGAKRARRERRAVHAAEFGSWLEQHGWNETGDEHKLD